MTNIPDDSSYHVEVGDDREDLTKGYAKSSTIPSAAGATASIPPSSATPPPPSSSSPTGPPEHHASLFFTLLNEHCLRGPCKRIDKETGFAMGLVAFSAFIYSLQSLNVKLLNEDNHFWTISFFRGLSGGIASIISALANTKRTSPLWGQDENRKWLCIRGLMGGITIITAFAAISAMPLAGASVIIFTSPLWTAALAVYVEKGAWTKADTISAICCLIGMVLLLAPQANHHHQGPTQPYTKGSITGGVISAFISAISMAGVNMSIRKVKKEDTSVITLYAMVGCLVLAFPGMIYEQVHHVGEQIAYMGKDDILQLLLTGLLSWGAQMTKTWALQISKSLGVLVMRYLDILFAFIWETAILHSIITPSSVIGAMLIVGGCLYSLLSKGNG